MYVKLAKRLLFETDKRLLWKLFWNMGIKGIRSVEKYKARLRRGQFFPPYLYISIINSCNLRCQGCWVDVSHKQQTIDVPAMDKMIKEAKRVGNSFFGILGGEPFMHQDLMQILGNHPDCYFQVFTNGHFITDKVAKDLRKLGNVTLLVSVEGDEIVSDIRRGKPGVWSKSMEGVQNCLNNKLLTGVCTSLCQSNIDDLLTEAWVDRLVELGVMYTWFHVYRAVGPDACDELALTPEQQTRARKFVVDIRATKPIFVIDAYYDGQGKALCPAATGFTHHISPAGDIEPCPVIQASVDSIHAGSLIETFNQSEYLRDFRKLAASSSRGCIALERPDLIEKLIQKHHAQDSTFRKTYLEELAQMTPKPSQSMQAEQIPERNFLYWLAKRFWFHDFGAYDHPVPIETILQADPKGHADSAGQENPFTILN